jgi:hypothetical protein
MPTDPQILGFSSRFYENALESAEEHRIAGRSVRVLTFPYFVATKLEAFKGRGKGDYYTSKDIEDLIAVFAGRPGFSLEFANSPIDVQNFIHNELLSHLNDREFLSAISGHLPRDSNITPGETVT